MTLAAHEDKTYRGGYIASPTMPWVWGTGLENPSGAYHLVWSRDLYQIATALIAAGDTPAPTGRSTTSSSASRSRTARSRRTRSSTARRTGAICSSTRWRSRSCSPGSSAARTRLSTATTSRRRRTSSWASPNAPFTPQERWENQSGYSPGTIASEIAGLVCAADIARRNGDTASADRYLRTADDWQKRVDGWTATTNGPYSPRPYYLRLTKDGKPELRAPPTTSATAGRRWTSARSWIRASSSWCASA